MATIVKETAMMFGKKIVKFYKDNDDTIKAYALFGVCVALGIGLEVWEVKHTNKAITKGVAIGVANALGKAVM